MDNTEKNSIKASFDLEAIFDEYNTSKMPLETIFEETLRILQEIEKQLDQLAEKD